MKRWFWGKIQTRCYFVFWLVLVTILSVITISDISEVVKNWLNLNFGIQFFTEVTKNGFPTDKIVHFLFYFVLTLLCYLRLKWKKIQYKLLLSFGFSVFWGILMEIFQKFYTESRTGDVSDVIYNIFGTVVAILIIRVKLKKVNYKSI